MTAGTSEAVYHFLFECQLWEHLRQGIREAMGNQVGDLSLALGGKQKEHQGKNGNLN